MAPLVRPLTESDFVELFGELARELAAQREVTTIVLAGGAYMTFLHLRDATADADAISRLPLFVKEAAAAVATRHRLRSTWLNDSAIAFAPSGAPAKPAYTFFEDRFLRVVGPHPDVVFLMKIAASRATTNDRADAIALWSRCSFQSAQEAVDAFHSAFPDEEPDPYLVDFVAEIAAKGEPRP